MMTTSASRRLVSPGIDQGDVHVRLIERGVVVAPVPEEDVRLRLDGFQDSVIVDAGEDHAPVGDVRLVLLPLLDRHLVVDQVLLGGEALDPLVQEVAVGHGMAHHSDPVSPAPQDVDDGTARLAFSDARARGADGHRGNGGFEHGSQGVGQLKVGARGVHSAGQVTHVLV